MASEERRPMAPAVQNGPYDGKAISTTWHWVAVSIERTLPSIPIEIEDTLVYKARGDNPDY